MNLFFFQAIKQFEYLEKSLKTFQEKTEIQTASLRKPVAPVEEKLAHDGVNLDQENQEDPYSKVSLQPGKTGGSAFVGAAPVYIDVNYGNSSAMVPLGVLYTEGDNSEFDDQHLQHLQPVLVEGEGYLYGIKSVQKVQIKESVRGHDFVSVHSGPHHSLAITAGGQVVSWGANDYRQLGYQGAEDGVLGLEMIPQHVKNGLTGEIVVSAACGAQHSVVITEDGKVFSWGAYLSGQLGLGEVSKEKFPYGYKDQPDEITALDTRAPRAVACGDFHTVLIDGLGDLWTFGTVEKHANGHDGKYDEPSPKLLDNPKIIVGIDFRQVACGSFHTLALTASGQIWAWGWNEFGQLGLNDIQNRRHPERLVEFSARNIRKIACGETHSICLSDRDVYTFGNGAQGALGHGNAKSQRQPKKVMKITDQNRIRDVEAGPQYTVAITDLGQMYFWGNMKSTSGRGAKHVYNVPVRFKGLEAIYGVACGWHEVTALVRIPVPPPLEHQFKAGGFPIDPLVSCLAFTILRRSYIADSGSREILILYCSGYVQWKSVHAS
jgi:alpha-tubulin suppressor-like RCC1 family protein